MDTLSSAKEDKEAVDTEQMKGLVQGAISATSVIHLLRSVCTSSKCNHVQAYRHVAAEMDVCLIAYSLSQQIIGSKYITIYIYSCFHLLLKISCKTFIELLPDQDAVDVERIDTELCVFLSSPMCASCDSSVQ